jgi:hypothetical protein
MEKKLITRTIYIILNIHISLTFAALFLQEDFYPINQTAVHVERKKR